MSRFWKVKADKSLRNERETNAYVHPNKVRHINVYGIDDVEDIEPIEQKTEEGTVEIPACRLYTHHDSGIKGGENHNGPYYEIEGLTADEAVQKIETIIWNDRFPPSPKPTPTEA